jgi:biotin synthase
MDKRTTSSGANESPQFVKLSLASAMTLDLAPGKFFRGATNPCINLLLTYEEGCSANCSYCGLARERAGKYTDKSFINVSWPIHPLDILIQRMQERRSRLKRVCLSMITNSRTRKDSVEVIERLHPSLDLPLSVLISPTVSNEGHLIALKQAGADRIGVAIDCATEELFEQHRGRLVNGPHRWAHYWKMIDTTARMFGPQNVGIHLMVGLGETEAELVNMMRRIKAFGGQTHLFSFFAEQGSAMDTVAQPPVSKYRRMQLARHIIEKFDKADAKFQFDSEGQLIDFGLDGATLESILAGGEAFMTSGCPGRDGKVACNRPFGNCLLPEIRNYPFRLDEEDLHLVRTQLGGCISAV